MGCEWVKGGVGEYGRGQETAYLGGHGGEEQRRMWRCTSE